jgi:ATP-dependent Clp protease ATP-binding subunit ClpC
MADVVAMMTGIPVNKIAESESTKLLKMAEILKDQVVGQDEAILKLTKAFRRTRAGLKDPTRPIGSFIFLGPTGVGKTELAKALARYLFDTEDALIRIDRRIHGEIQRVAPCWAAACRMKRWTAHRKGPRKRIRCFA